MKVFISWSGEVSHSVAVELREWLPNVIQSLDIYVSSEDIEKGTRWFAEIGKELQSTNFGISCLTPTNLNRPWMLFEAGALSKHLDQSRVVPLLIGLTPSDLTGPLAQFNATSIAKADMLKLIKTINKYQEANRLKDEQLLKTFETWWSDIETALSAADRAAKQAPPAEAKRPVRNTQDILEEILTLSRSAAQQLNDLAKQQDSSPLLSEDVLNWIPTATAWSAGNSYTFPLPSNVNSALALKAFTEAMHQRTPGDKVRENEIPTATADASKDKDKK